MKKLFAIIIAVALIFVLCSCQTADEVTSNNSSYSEPAHSSETSDTTSETEEPIVSETESSDTVFQPVESKPIDTSSITSTTDTPKDTSSKEIPVEEPQEPINFVPNKFPPFNHDTGKVDYEKATISYTNDVFYKGVRYACTQGKNNGVGCAAIVTVGANGEYLKCVYILDNKNNERGFFNIYNDRIYFLKYELNDDRDYKALNEISICSVNLSGKDKKIEKNADLSFTHISMQAKYLNSKYIFFEATNILEDRYDIIYRYNMETNELTELSHRINSKSVAFSVGERIFVWNSENQEIYEHDIGFARLKFFHLVEEDLFVTNPLLPELTEKGLLLHNSNRLDKYLLDFSGNRTQIS